MPETITIPTAALHRIQRKLVFAVIFHLVGGLFLVMLAMGQFNSAPAPTTLTPFEQGNRDKLEHTNACLLGGNNKPADCPTTSTR